MGDAALTLAMASEKFSRFVEQGKLLAKKQITRNDLDNFLIRLELERANTRENGFDKEKVEAFKRTTKYQELVAAFYRSPGAKEAGATLWGALNAITYHTDHEASARVTDNFSGQNEARLNSAWFNSGTVRKNRALELCLEIASKG